MAEKARLFCDPQAAAAILGAATPKAAKALGRKVKNFDEKVWGAHCREIVTRGNVEKFRQNDSPLDFLLATTGKVLVEACPRDRIWGIGLRQDDPRAMNPALWQGSQKDAQVSGAIPSGRPFWRFVALLAHANPSGEMSRQQGAMPFLTRGPIMP